MKKRKCAVLAALILVIPWLLTGGCVSFQSAYRYVESYNKNYRPFISVKVASNYQTYGVPFLFTYIDDVPPYDADFIYYTQDIVEGAELTIERIAIRYSDGTEANLTDQAEKVLATEPYEMWYVEDHAEVKKPSLRAKWTVRNCITQRGSFTLMMSGKLQKGNRVLEPFNTSLKCVPFDYPHCYSRWYWWMLSNA